MESKVFELRAPATLIVILATRLGAEDEAQRYLLARAGYGMSKKDQGKYILLQAINGGGGKATTDPYKHHFQEMTIAHQFILEHFDDLEPGAVVDTSYIMGHTEQPKQAARFETGWWDDQTNWD